MLAQLELGRNVLLGQVLDGRADVADLRAHYPVLADRYEALAGAFDGPEDPEAPGPPGNAATVHPWERRQRLAADWEQLIATVRRRPGFEDFLKPPDPGQLATEAAPHGPVVVLNAAVLGCDALILRDGRVHRVALPCDFEELCDVARAFSGDTREATNSDALVLLQARAQEKVRDALAWLWNEVAGPVLDALGFTAGLPADGVLPRMWWVPTGPFTVLPLHAAGHRCPSGPNALDHVVSSYAVGLRELARARSRPAPRERTVLTVAQPHPTEGRSLGAVADELAGVPAGTLLTGTKARPDAVLTALPQHTWAHFACHAKSPTQAEPHGSLELHNAALTTADIASLRLSHAGLAYLSACSATRGKDSLSDEALHITGAMQTAGFSHVVGTLWPADDETCAAVTRDFYARLTARRGEKTAGDASNAARDLHAAVQAIRADYPNTPTYWANYVHYGP